MMRFKLLTIKDYEERTHIINDIEVTENVNLLSKDISIQKIYASRIGNGQTKSDLIKDKTLKYFCQINIPNDHNKVLDLNDFPKEALDDLVINQENFFN